MFNRNMSAIDKVLWHPLTASTVNAYSIFRFIQDGFDAWWKWVWLIVTLLWITISFGNMFARGAILDAIYSDDNYDGDGAQ